MEGFSRELFLKVKKHMSWTEEKTILWFNTRNPHMGNLTPLRFLHISPEKAERTILALMEN